MAQANKFFPVGAIPANDQSLMYIERSADRDLEDLIEQGHFVHILTSRQMGKTSLINRHRKKLERAGIRTAYVDVSTLGQQAEKQWYRLFIERAAESLKFKGVRDWMSENESKRILHADLLIDFLEEVARVHNQSKLVIYVDEIESLLKLWYRDTFFNRLRELDTISRNSTSRLSDRLLLFVLAGVATPDQLRSIKSNTSYNYSRPVLIDDFSREQMLEFLPGLQDFFNPGEILNWVWDYTRGHPCQSQILCDEIVKSGGAFHQKHDVESLIHDLLKNDSVLQANTKTIGTYLTDQQAHFDYGVETLDVLALYRRILRPLPALAENGGASSHLPDLAAPISQFGIPDIDGDITYSYLKLIGVVRPVYRRLQIRNPIYQILLDDQWIEENLKWYRSNKRSIQPLDGRMVVGLRVIGEEASTITKSIEDLCNKLNFAIKLITVIPESNEENYQEIFQTISKSDVYLAVIGSSPQPVLLTAIEVELAATNRIEQQLITLNSEILAPGFFLPGITHAVDSIEKIGEAAEEFLLSFLDKPSQVAERRALTDYLVNVMNDNSLVDSVGAQTVPEPPGLHEVYIDLQAVSETPDVDQRAMYEELFLAGEQALTSREKLERQQEIWGNQDRSQLRSENTGTSRTKLTELISTERRLVILGDPGSGKTTFLRFLTRRFAESAISNIDLLMSESTVCPDVWWQDSNLGPTQIPLFVRIPSYVEFWEDTRAEAPSFGKYLSQHHHKRFSHQVGEKLARLIDHMIQAGRCLILLDGLDEVGDRHDRARVVNEIERRLSNAEPNANRVIVTSRIVGYQFAPLSSAFSAYTISAMDNDQIQRFITLRCRSAVAKNDPSKVLDVENTIDKIWRAVENSKHARKLAENPLLLSILIRVYQTGSIIPQRRIQLYIAATQQMLQDWKDFRSPDTLEGYVVDVLGPLAVYLHENIPSGVLQQSEVLRRLKTNIELAFTNQIEDPEKEALRFLDYLRDHPGSGIFVERGQGMFGFRHLTFEEYCVARNAFRGTVAPYEFIRKYLHQPRWREPLLLAIAHQSDTNPYAATEHLRGILNNPSRYEQILHRDKLFVVDALLECIKVDHALIGELCGSLLQIYCDQHGMGRYSRLRGRIRLALSNLHQQFRREVEEAISNRFSLVKSRDEFEFLMEIIQQLELESDRFPAQIAQSPFFRSSPTARDVINLLETRHKKAAISQEDHPLAAWAKRDSVAASIGALWATGDIQDVLTAALALPESTLSEIYRSAARMNAQNILSLMERIIPRAAEYADRRTDFIDMILAMVLRLRIYAQRSGDRKLESFSSYAGPFIYTLEASGLETREIAEELERLLAQYGFLWQPPPESSSQFTDWGRQILTTAQGGRHLSGYLESLTEFGWEPSNARFNRSDFGKSIERLHRTLVEYSLSNLNKADSLEMFYEIGIFLSSGPGLTRLLRQAVEGDANKQKTWARQVLSDRAFVASVRCNSNQRETLAAWLKGKEGLASTALALLLASEGVTPWLLDAAMMLAEQNKSEFHSRILPHLDIAVIKWTADLLIRIKHYLNNDQSRSLALRLLARTLKEPRQDNALLDWLSDEFSLVRHVGAIRYAAPNSLRSRINEVESVAKLRISEYVEYLFNQSARASSVPEETGQAFYKSHLSPNQTPNEVREALGMLLSQLHFVPLVSGQLADLVLESPDWRASLAALSMLLNHGLVTPKLWSSLRRFSFKRRGGETKANGAASPPLEEWMVSHLRQAISEDRFPIGTLLRIANDQDIGIRAAAGLAILCADLQNQMVKELTGAATTHNDLFHKYSEERLYALCELLPSDGSTEAVGTLEAWYREAALGVEGAQGTLGVTAMSRVVHDSPYWIDRWMAGVVSESPTERFLSRKSLVAWLSLRGRALETVCTAARGEDNRLQAVAIESLRSSIFDHEEMRSNPQILDTLLYALKEGDGRVKRSAAETLAWVSIQSSTLAETLISQIENLEEEESTKITCLLSLGRLLNEVFGASDVPHLIKTYKLDHFLRDSASEDLRRAAMCAIAEVMLPVKEAARIIIDLFPSEVSDLTVLQAMLDARTFLGTVSESKLNIEAVSDWLLELRRPQQQTLIQWLVGLFERQLSRIQSYHEAGIEEKIEMDEAEHPFDWMPDLKVISNTLCILSERFPLQFFGDLEQRHHVAGMLAKGAQHPFSWQVRKYCIQTLGNLQILNEEGMEALSRSCYDIDKCAAATDYAIEKFKEISLGIVQNLNRDWAAENSTRKLANAVKLIGKLGIYRSDTLSQRAGANEETWRQLIGGRLADLMEVCDDMQILDDQGRQLGTVGDAIFEALEQVESGPDAVVAELIDASIKGEKELSALDPEEAFPSSGLQPSPNLPLGISNVAGWSEEQLRRQIEMVRKNLGWEQTAGSARKWWQAFEDENQHRLALILRLAEELQNRKATITEFFLTYVYSNTENIQANLHFLDYKRLKNNEEEKKKKNPAAPAIAPKRETISNQDVQPENDMSGDLEEILDETGDEDSAASSPEEWFQFEEYFEEEAIDSDDDEPPPPAKSRLLSLYSSVRNFFQRRPSVARHGETPVETPPPQSRRKAYVPGGLGNHVPSAYSELPPGITNTAGCSNEALLKMLESTRARLDWQNTVGSARKWWETFEKENQNQPALALRLAEELANRKATITEFFLAYTYSNTENIQANLHYLDYTRLKKEEEKRKKEAARQSDSPSREEDPSAASRSSDSGEMNAG